MLVYQAGIGKDCIDMAILFFSGIEHFGVSFPSETAEISAVEGVSSRHQFEQLSSSS